MRQRQFVERKSISVNLQGLRASSQTPTNSKSPRSLQGASRIRGSHGYSALSSNEKDVGQPPSATLCKLVPNAKRIKYLQQPHLGGALAPAPFLFDNMQKLIDGFLILLALDQRLSQLEPMLMQYWICCHSSTKLSYWCPVATRLGRQRHLADCPPNFRLVQICRMLLVQFGDQFGRKCHVLVSKRAQRKARRAGRSMFWQGEQLRVGFGCLGDVTILE
mmetsp:Transcript_59544/g.98728  ORF Transcript_59544/g.98728 Transcript_59544/m.98728 type:complete len:219 (+) Transcript_59544:291-947(+)